MVVKFAWNANKWNKSHFPLTVFAMKLAFEVSFYAALRITLVYDKIAEFAEVIWDGYKGTSIAKQVKTLIYMNISL